MGLSEKEMETETISYLLSEGDEDSNLSLHHSPWELLRVWWFEYLVHC